MKRPIVDGYAMYTPEEEEAMRLDAEAALQALEEQQAEDRRQQVVTRERWFGWQAEINHGREDAARERWYASQDATDAARADPSATALLKAANDDERESRLSDKARQWREAAENTRRLSR